MLKINKIKNVSIFFVELVSSAYFNTFKSVIHCAAQIISSMLRFRLLVVFIALNLLALRRSILFGHKHLLHRLHRTVIKFNPPGISLSNRPQAQKPSATVF